MLKRFQKYSFSSILITFSIALIIFIFTFIFKQKDLFFDNYYSPFFSFIKRWYGNSENWLVFSGILLLLLQSFYLAYYTNKEKLFGVNTFIAALILLILNSYPKTHFLSPVLISNTLIVFAYVIYLKTIKSKKSTGDFFKISILLAIASLFYFQYVFLIIFSIVSVFIIRSKPTKEILTVIIGFAVTYIFYVEIYFLINNQWIDLKPFWESLSIMSFKFDNSIFFLIYLIIIGFIFILSNLNILQKIGTKEIEKRTIFQLTFSLFVFFILLYSFIPNISINFINSFSIPITILFGDFFANLKIKFLNKLIFVIFTISAFIFIAENIFEKLF